MNYPSDYQAVGDIYLSNNLRKKEFFQKIREDWSAGIIECKSISDESGCAIPHFRIRSTQPQR